MADIRQAFQFAATLTVQSIFNALQNRRLSRAVVAEDHRDSEIKVYIGLYELAKASKFNPPQKHCPPPSLVDARSQRIHRDPLPMATLALAQTPANHRLTLPHEASIPCLRPRSFAPSTCPTDNAELGSEDLS